MVFALYLVQALSIVFVSISVLCVQRRYFHRLSRYPGPWLASVTNLWRIVVILGGRHHSIDQQLHETYGPVVRVGPKTLMFSDPSAHEAIYGFNKHMEKGPLLRLSGDPGKFIPQVEFISVQQDNCGLDPNKASLTQTVTDDQHREKRRKVVSPALTTRRIAAYEDAITTNVKIFMTHLTEKTPSGGSEPLNVAVMIHRLSFDTYFEVIFGASIGSQRGEIDDALLLKSNILLFGLVVPLMPLLGSIFTNKTVVRWMRKPRYDSKGQPKGYRKIIDPSQIAVRQAYEKSRDSSSSILHNLERVPCDDNRRMDQDEAWRECFIASTGSTAACLNVILYELAVRPEWQERILSEARNKITSFSCGTCSTIPSSEINALLTLQAVIKESLRYSPPFATTFPRYITSGAEDAITFLRMSLPIGTLVETNHYVICRSKEIWGEDADEWKPERWLQSEKISDEGWPVFGRGSRSCVGKEVAWMVLNKTIFAVLNAWEISARPGSLKGRNNFEMQYSELPLLMKPRRERTEVLRKERESNG